MLLLLSLLLLLLLLSSSSVIFVRLAFGPILENLRKSSESGWKSSENCQILYYKKKII